MSALYANTTGYSNVAVGVSALFNNTTESNLVAVGDSALFNNTSGAANTAIGSKALYANTSGNNNTANGLQALNSNTSGNSNTANGSLALNDNTTGYYNTALGYFAFFIGAAYVNSTALGYSATITGSYQVRIGNSSVGSIGGVVAWSVVSDARFKTEVKENVPGLEFINKLRAVTYHLDVEKLDDFLGIPDSLDNDEFTRNSKIQKAAVTQTGFIAQEVEKTAQSLGYDFSGVDAPQNENDHYGLRYAKFVVPLVKAVQELAGRNDQLTDHVGGQQEIIEELEKEIGSLKDWKAGRLELEAGIEKMEDGKIGKLEERIEKLEALVGRMATANFASK